MIKRAFAKHRNLAGALALLLTTGVVFPALGSDTAAAAHPYSGRTVTEVDRSRLPAALQNVPLERLSSGALIRLGLAESDEDWNARVARAAAADVQERKAAVALDRRVGANIRLGDDPPELPSFRRAQAEPHIARSPTDPDFLVATFQEGRFRDGGAVNCGYSTSRDGGVTWSRALLPGAGAVSGGPYERVTDPVAGFDRAGNAYVNTLGLITGTTSTGTQDFDGSVIVSRSTDGGVTFGQPVLAYKEPNADTFADKNWMAINNFPGTPTAGRIILTFTIFSNVGGTAHPIARVYSDDQGATWSPLAYIHSLNNQVQGSQPVFLRDGRLVIVYWNFMGTSTFADDRLELVVSNDGGNTFGPPRPITNVAIYGPPNIRSGGFLPSVTTDRETGTLFLTYQARHEGQPRIMFMRSSDAGNSWSTPIPISNNPPNSGVFNPAIASSADGRTLTVAFYDLRDNPGSTTRCDMYLAQSFDGGNTWQPNIRLSSESTDAALAVNTGSDSNPSYMLGDYIGIAEPVNSNVPAVPVWVDTRTGDPDPFVTRVGIAPQLDFTSWQAARLSFSQTGNPASGGESGDADGDNASNSSEYNTDTEPNEFFHTGRQLNISTRARVQTGENILIGGFIVTGNEPKRVVIRALGPSLTGAGVPGALQNPTLQLLTDNNALVAENDDWRQTQESEITATGIPPADDREAAIVQTLSPGNYTAAVRGAGDTAGVALVEIYDLAPGANSRLANISTRSFVEAGENVMIGGLIIGAGAGPDGAGSTRVVLRATGPSLSQQGVTGALQDPELLLFDANGSVIETNDNWRQTEQADVRTLNLAPRDDREAALVASLPRGSYTAIVRGRDGTTGVALIEAYNVQ